MIFLRRSPSVSRPIAYIDYCLDHGAVGGSFTDRTISGVKGGEIAARVLVRRETGEHSNSPKFRNSPQGRLAPTSPVEHTRVGTCRPARSFCIDSQPSGNEYEKYVVAGIVLIILQALLIVGLLWQRARKRKTEATLRESEKRFRVMANTTPSLVWMCDKNGNVTYLNEDASSSQAATRRLGLTTSGRPIIHPDDCAKCPDGERAGTGTEGEILEGIPTAPP